MLVSLHGYGGESGDSGDSSGTLEKVLSEYFTATSGQTVFTLSNSGITEVSKGGLELTPIIDYTFDASGVVLLNSALEDETIIIDYYA